jgi:hypothetical protein
MFQSGTTIFVYSIYKAPFGWRILVALPQNYPVSCSTTIIGGITYPSPGRSSGSPCPGGGFANTITYPVICL